MNDIAKLQRGIAYLENNIIKKPDDMLTFEDWGEIKATMADALQEKLERINPQPLTLEQLREMEGEPVWIYELEDEFTYWEVVVSLTNNGFVLADKMGGDFGSFELYGKTWVAYRYKPVEEGETK